ncbi:caspase activity and apoptosis inhibitor 1 isoform X1 [Bufo gargarizans]|uniref:caspase activity and apoptosis inhibitor 1 isoform X1 n=1 Tax=Bufo gargarizans TaxID=30331 RepID=UPI001CF2ED47|nr:caspase activity and apoptosis inhibitor 1 isoform X1 [Bufo gargarizans]
MTGGKKSTKEKKKRRRSASCDTGSQGERKKRSTEPSQQVFMEPESSALFAGTREEDVEELSDIEEGGLDLSVPLKPISFYISDRKEMLDHCFRVLGDRKLKKMLPDMLKDLSLDEIKQLCLEQVEMETDESLLRILQGDHEEENEGNSRAGLSSQNDNIEMTSSVRANSGYEEVDVKTGKGEDYDALSINADTYDSDIEGASCEDRIHETPIATGNKATGQPDDLVMDIEKSVNEILGLAEPVEEVAPTVPVAVLPEDIQPSAQQLELLELEMRARAIKALMKAGDVKKT